MQIVDKAFESLADMECGSVAQRAESEQKRIQSFAFVIAVVVCVLFSAGFTSLVLTRSGSAGEVKLETKINPNNAAMASLVRLPGIGVVRAQGIVAYRDAFKRQNSAGVAFENHDDLQKVKGIGPKTVENVSQWLKF